MKLKFRLKFNHDFSIHGYLHSGLKSLIQFWDKKRRQDITNFSFKMFKIMRSLRSSKCLKTTVELTFTTQKANACSPWTACSVFDWKYLFWVSLVQKLNLSYQKTYHLSWNFVLRLIQIFIISWWCSLFLFLTGNTFCGKLGPKKKHCQFELKFSTRLNWICRII